MARLRSLAHFGTTRSGQRCIARCAQSYLPSQSASHVAFNSFCQALCWGTSRQRGAKLMMTPSSRFGFQSGATRFTSSRNVRRLLDERLLRRHLLALRGRAPVAKLALQRFKAALFVRELGRDVVVLDAEERVLGEGMNVEPHRVARGRRCELPVDRRLATALAVHFDVQREELVREPGAKIFRHVDANAFGSPRA